MDPRRRSPDEDGLPGQDRASREVPFQSPSPTDLDQFPPAGEGCRAIRAMLRDYADADLSERDRAPVDEHVHTCRDCGLALSRMELEVLRIRKALHEDRAAAAEPPADLTARVMAEVGRVVLSEDAPPGFTTKVMLRVRKEWRPTPWRRLIGWLGVPGTVLVSAAMVLIAMTAVVTLTRFGEAPAVRVLFARHATILRPGSAAPAHPTKTATATETGPEIEIEAVTGMVLTAGDVLLTGVNGEASLELGVRDTSGDTGRAAPASRVDLEAESRVRRDRRGITLLLGSLQIEAQRPMRLPIEGLAELRLFDGSFLVGVERVRRVDGELTPEPSLRARVEVLRGRARIARGDAMRPVEVREGFVAHFDSLSPVLVEPGLSEAVLEQSRAAAARRNGVGVANATRLVPGAQWVGRVVAEPGGASVPGARVQVVSSAGTENTVTDQDGFFSFSGGRRDAEIAVVQVLPPEDRPDLAAHGPEPVALTAVRGAPRELPRIALYADRPVRGRVRAPDGGAVADASVLPCVLDEPFGLLAPIESATRRTGPDGYFELRGLPRALEQHQTLVLLVEHRDHPTSAFLELGQQYDGAAAGALVPLDLVVAGARDLRLSGLQPNRSVSILQAVPGLPVRTMASRYEVVTDALGRAELHGVGPGPCWVLDLDDRRLLRLAASHAAGEEVFEPTDETRIDWASVARLTAAPQRLDEPPGRVDVRASGHRLGAVELADAGVEPRYLAVVDAERPVVGTARLYVRLASGAVRYIGEYDGSSSVPFAPPADGDYQVFAIGADGSFGVISSDEVDRRGFAIEVREPGSVELGDPLRPPAGEGESLVSFRITDGPLAGTTFWRLFRIERGWSLSGMVPGTYEVTMPDGRRAACVITAGRIAQVLPLAEAGDATGGEPRGR